MKYKFQKFTCIKLFIPILFVIILISSCQKSEEFFRNEIAETEKAFAKMANEKGIKDAFIEFAADEVALIRNDKLIRGKDSLQIYYDNPFWKDVKLSWEPTHIEVSKSGDLAYTYGNYTLSQPDSTGKYVKSEGIFHTVWKRQKDGSWKFVWD